MAPKRKAAASAPGEQAVSAIDRQSDLTAKRAAESMPEMDRLLNKAIPKVLEDFVGAYGKFKKAEDLLKAAPWLDPARDLSQVIRHFRELSWRMELQQEQAAKLQKSLEPARATLQSIVTLVGNLDLQASLSKQVSPAAFLGAILLGLEVATFYCVLASSFGTPPALVVEEVTLGIVRCLRQCVRQLVVPMLSPEVEKGKKASGAESAALPFSAEESTAVCSAVASLMQALHEFLSRHKLAEDQLHQLIHLALSIFFQAEPNFRLCSVAEEVLVTIFGRSEALRASILQEFLVRVPRLPTGKRAKRFQLPATEEDADYGLSTWTHLLLRLSQSTCLPLNEPIGADVDFDMLMERRPAAQAVVTQLTHGLLQRLVLTRSKDEEARAILEEFTEELLAVAFKPMWPGALALLRSLVQQLILLLQEKKQAGDVTVREFSLKVLSRALVRLWHHASQTAQHIVELPDWTAAPEEHGQSSHRLLQHIALRISVEDGREMPWTEAARAVEAWDAELFLAKGANDVEAAGLKSLSDEIVFLHLTMAFLADESNVPLLCPPTCLQGSSSSSSSSSAPPASLSAAVFAANHAVHSWSFMVCDLAESASQAGRAAEAGEELPAPRTSRGARGKDKGEKPRVRTAQTPLERFLGSAWCSPTLVVDTASWRGAGGGRRLLLPHTIFKVYRQLRSIEFDGLRKAALDCVVMQANSAQASLRKTAMRALSDLVDMDVSVLTMRTVQETVDMRLRDESSWVRQVSLDLLGRILEGSMGEGGGDEEVSAPKILSSSSSSSATARNMLLHFHKTVRGRVNDTAVIVRRQATKILSAFVLNHPEHPDVVPVTLDLLRRSTDSDALRNLVFGTFELLWFMDDEPTSQAARQLSRVVDAARSMQASVGDLLQELLRRFRKTIGSRKNSKGYEFAIRRWTTLILNEFVQLRCKQGQKMPAAPVQKKAKGEAKLEPAAAETAEEQWLMRRSLLSTLEAFAAAQPKDLLVHLRPLTIYLALEDSSPPEEQWIAVKVCRILSSVLPYVAERRGLMDHRQVQFDLQALIRSQPSSGVHEAVRCLCLVVKYVTGDLAQLVSHLNVAVPSLLRLCTMAEQKRGSLERIQLMYMSRQAWVLASVLESLAIDDYVQLDGISAAEQPKRRVLPRSELKFDFVGDSVATTVADIMLRMNALGEPQLRAVAVSCLGFFLKGHRSYTKDKRIGELLASALSSGDLQLCKKALETLASLLGHFRLEAEHESKAGAADFGDSRDGSIAGQHGAQNLANKTNSAIEAAQPLAAFSDAVLSHITLAGSVGPAAGRQLQSPVKRQRAPKRSGSQPEETPPQEEDQRAEDVLKVRVEALAVVRHLHQQGLVNPMAVLPKVFALAFAGDARLSEPATAMLKEMLELRPSLLLNRLDEAFKEAFLALLSGATAAQPARLGEAPPAQQLSGLGDIYAERFRKQKAVREAFLRKALRELLRLQTERFEERFAELAAMGVVNQDSFEDYSIGAPVRGRNKASGRGRGSADQGGSMLGQLPLPQQQQLLYAQFMASALSSLPFSFENEPLLLIFECNHHLSLHAGTLLASYEGREVPGEEAQVSSPEQVFAEALAIVSCVVLKSALKKEYALTSEQCASFNPKEVRQERLKAFTVGFMGAAARSGDREDGQPAGIRVRFPASEWLEKVAPLVANFGRPSEIAAYIRKVTDTDPWDDSKSRHVEKIDRLEGRRTARRKGDTTSAAVAAQGNGEPSNKAPKPGRGGARARGRGANAPSAGQRRYGLRRRGRGDDDDSSYEDPAAKRRKKQAPARQEREAEGGDREQEPAQSAAEEEDELEEEAADID
eukprot:TRINITY_DN7748_c1_g1_i1.p1 TRINITY_DN7748_c1_g1~~TRINITY_DN7748_c1_g1_i1.p1  ORF type:complete len:1820 (-),score=460.89 TRINITY_DN7748_c1_g1_i1:106-5565(-)